MIFNWLLLATLALTEVWAETKPLYNIKKDTGFASEVSAIKEQGNYTLINLEIDFPYYEYTQITKYDAGKNEYYVTFTLLRVLRPLGLPAIALKTSAG